MAEGILAYLGLDMAKLGVSAVEIARVLNDRAADLRMYVSLDTLEYLKKGGRVSAAKAAIGTLLSMKPIIAVEAGEVDVADRPRTRAKSRERCIEMICARPIERLSILHTMAPDVDEFRAEVIRRVGHRLRRSSRRRSWARRWGRTSVPAASARRSSTRAERARLRQASGGPSGGGTNDCGTVAATLRYGRSAEAESRHGGYTPVAFICESHAPAGSPGRAPWGRPGDGPNAPAGRQPAARREVQLHPMTTEQVAPRSIPGRSRSSSSTWPPSGSTSTPACAASSASRAAS